MGFSETVERAILDGVFQTPAFAGYATLYLGLTTTQPTRAGGNITEPASGGYARVATTGASWSAATASAPAQKTNTATLTFPQATADWLAGANFAFFVLMDAATNGLMVARGTITTPKPVTSGDTASYPPGELLIRLGEPPDFP